jgi:hypothetical protein
VTRGKKAEDGFPTPSEADADTVARAFRPPAQEVHKGTMLDGTEVEYVVDTDGVMSCVSPASVAGMALTRRNDATKETPGTLKLVGKPKKG